MDMAGAMGLVGVAMDLVMVAMDLVMGVMDLVGVDMGMATRDMPYRKLSRGPRILFLSNYNLGLAPK